MIGMTTSSLGGERLTPNDWAALSGKHQSLNTLYTLKEQLQRL